MPKSNPKVVLVERVLTHYRVKIYQGFRDSLARDGIDFSLVYGQPDALEAKKKDTAHLEWATEIRNVYLPGGIVWQPCLGHVRDCELIIVEQANRLVLNYLLLGLRPFANFRLAFNGHGYGHQDEAGGFSNRIKRTYTNLADWWFPYTEPIAGYLTASGFARERISVLNNSIDTRELRDMAEAIAPQEVAGLKSDLGFGSDPVGIYCGGMYSEKEIPFLLEACRKVRERLPGFRMIFLGDGVDAGLVRKAAAGADWIHYPGPKFGRDKVRYLLASDVFLMPGLVGLAILDGFALGLPMLTTRYPFHSPEIAYLREGVNGMISDFDTDAYSRMVAEVLQDKALLERLGKGSRDSSHEYSLEKMVENFCEGVKRCLASR